jgi:hypothetical protein
MKKKTTDPNKREDDLMRAGELRAIILMSPTLAYLIFQLFLIYISWWFSVRRARSAFEDQLTVQGISEEQAKAMSEVYVEMKNDIQRSLWGLMRG